MQLRYIFVFFVAALAAGWLAPDLLPERQQAEQAPAVQRSSMLTGATDDMVTSQPYAAVEEQQIYGEPQPLAIDRSSDGHFYADVAVNGVPVGFLIDTGATAIALTGGDAEAIGLDWDEYNLQVVGRGASGDVYGKPVILDEVTLGDFVARNVPAAIVPNGLDKSLLGQAFLKEINTVNISGDEMVLR